MDRTAATHANHDELLLARLYGGDVDERERRLALDQIASCRACANLFADLGSIAVATATLPTPPRPRDFTLTEADAARIGRRSVGWTVFDWLGRTKALGGSMVAAGLVGVVLVGALSVLGPGSTASSESVTDNGVPVAEPGYAADGSGPPAVSQIGASPNEMSGASGAGVTAATAAPQVAVASAAAPPVPAVSAAGTGKLALATEQPTALGEGALGPSHAGQGGVAAGSSTAPSRAGSPPLAGGPTSPSGGPDPRSLALIAFAALATLGVLLLAIPRLAARRARRERA